MALGPVSFLTPEWGLVGLGALVPLAVHAVRGRRATRVRRTLGLPEPAGRERVLVAGAIAAVGLLAGVAAAQPVVSRPTPVPARADAEAYVVVDVTRSMLASERGAPTRFVRAREAAVRLRGELRDVPVGLASFADRVLPHLFPTLDRTAFAATLAETVGPGTPPAGEGIGRRITAVDALGALGSRNFFSASARRRVALVLSDFESVPFQPGPFADAIRGGHVELVLVRFWSASERIHGRVEDAGYAPDPGSGSVATRLAEASGGAVFDEGRIDDAIAEVRRRLGEGPTASVVDERAPRPIAYLAALAVLVPLGVVLARRNL